MTQHLEILLKDTGATHARETALGDPFKELRSPHSEVELHRSGVRGAFLFDGGGTGLMGGTLVAVYHHASGYPEWVRFHEDPREDWGSLPAAAREQLLALDLGGGEPDLDVDPAAVPAVPVHSCFRPGHLTSFAGQKTLEHHLISEDLVGFLWVLQQYEKSAGRPLEVVSDHRGAIFGTRRV